MDNFIYSNPTTAYFGKGEIKVLGKTIKDHGGSKVLLAYGGGSIKKKTASTMPLSSNSTRPILRMWN